MDKDKDMADKEARQGQNRRPGFGVQVLEETDQPMDLKQKCWIWPELPG